MSSPDYVVIYSIKNCLFQSKLSPIEDMTRFSSFAGLYKNTSTAFKQFFVHQKEQTALYSHTMNKTIFILKVFWIKSNNSIHMHIWQQNVHKSLICFKVNSKWNVERITSGTFISISLYQEYSKYEPPNCLL